MGWARVVGEVVCGSGWKEGLPVVGSLTTKVGSFWSLLPF